MNNTISTNAHMQVPLSGPDITEREIKYVNDVMFSGKLSIGPVLERFEQLVAEFTGVKYAVAVNSGTSGLHLLVKILGIGDGDEVITSPFSFISSSNCLLMERATPVFVDIDPKTLNLDISQIESRITEKTKALLPVDVFGQPVDMAAINEIAKKRGLKVIEDSCEAIGSEYNGVKAGKLCDAGVFAFYPNKQITTAEGGVIVTDSDNIAAMCRSLRSQGRPITGLWLEHERLGYNYRLSELHAALGVAQMERIDELLDKRDRVAGVYNNLLKDVRGVQMPYIAPQVNRMSWFVYVIRLDASIDRNNVMKRLIENGVGCRPYFTPIHLQSFYRDMYGYKEGDFPVTEAVSASTIALPFFSNMMDEQIEYVVMKVIEGIQ